MKFKIFSAIALFVSMAASQINAQMLTIGDDGIIQGNAIFRSENVAYYTCSDVVRDAEFVKGMFDALTVMSNSLGVAAPQNTNCVLSQSFIFGNLISLMYFIDDNNAGCFYNNFCNDTRSATMLPTGNSFDVNLLVSNAATGTTVSWCLSASRGFLRQHCRE